jgi:hypothetical protein
MIYPLLPCFIGLVLDLFATVHTAPDEKDLQIVQLRQQLGILERKTRTKPLYVTKSLSVSSSSRNFDKIAF